MNNIFVISLAVVSSLSVEMTSCSSTNVYDENAESNLKTDEYKSNWTKLIGSIDPNQDWNMMTKRNITVDIHLGLSGSYKINLYNKQPGVKSNESQIIATADAQDNQTTTFSVSIPLALDTLYIGCAVSDSLDIVHQVVLSDGGFSTVFGNSVSKVKTRAAITSSSLVAETSATSYPGTIIGSVKAVMPESKKSNLTSNYAFVSNGLPFTVRPICGGEMFKDRVGYIAIHKDGTKTDHVLIDNTLTSDHMIIHWNNARKYKINGNPWTYIGMSEVNKIFRYYQVDNNNPAGLAYWGITSSYFNVYDDNDSKTVYQPSPTKDPDNILSKGYVINEPAGTMIVFYICNAEYNYEKFYSLQNWNSDGMFHSSVVNKDGYTFVGLEDKGKYAQYGSDFDCNDVVFDVKGADVVEVTTQKPYTYTIAFEDMGTTDDYDFNDIVLNASYVQQITTSNVADTKVSINNMKVSLVAAGGTLPTYVYYNDGGKSIDLFGKEIHEAFGVSTSTMVNTGGTVKTTVPSTTISPTSLLNFDISTQNAASGFYIVVKNYNSNQTVSLPDGTEKGIAPQGLVIPGDWNWPMERVSINTVYKEFGIWGGNISLDNGWYQSCSDDSKVMNESK